MGGQDFEYKGDKSKTDENHDADGFFTVGDVGYLNEDGFLFLCDRKSDMIIAGGVNIYPAEIEGEILAHPGVGDVAVFGIPDDDMGEQIKAVVEPAPGVRGRRRAGRVDHGAPRRAGWPSSSGPSRSTSSTSSPRAHRQAPQAPAPRPVLGRPRPGRSDPVACGAMEVVARVLAFLGGRGARARRSSAPRCAPSWCRGRSRASSPRSVFVGVRKLFDLRVRKASRWEDADRIMARYAPICLCSCRRCGWPGVLLGFTPMFWALGQRVPAGGVHPGGSSLLTLGFAFAKDLPETTLSFVAATIGLGLVALLISFLPSIYSQFSRREVLVGQLDTRAGTPPDAVVLLRRAARHRVARPSSTTSGSTGSGGSSSSRRATRPTSPCRSSAASTPSARGSRRPGACSTRAALRAVVRRPPSQLPRPSSASAPASSSLRRIAEVFDIDFDPDPAPDRSDLGDPRGVRRRVRRAGRAAALPLRADRDRPGATSPAGGSTTTRCCSACAR